MLPTLSEFVQMPSSEVQPLVKDKVVVFSPGGSSRWYFLEHGDISQGYSQAERFKHYVQKSIQRTFEIVQLMMADGIPTLFLVGIMPGQTQRDPAYRQNLANSLAYMVNDDAQAFYDQHDIGVLFRGDWQYLFNQLNVSHLLDQCQQIEETTRSRQQWLIWLTRESPVPQELAPVLKTALQSTGQVPDHETLSRAYYAGRPIQHIDFFISHNKPTLNNQLPPLTTLGDTYFTFVPCYYMDRQIWRTILYDHLFARRGNKRDYSAYTSETIAELQRYVRVNRHNILGSGKRHAASQSWRPVQAINPDEHASS